MDRLLQVWGLRSLLLIALVLAVPVGQASAQGAAAGPMVQSFAPLAQEESDESAEPAPAEEPPADLGPSNEAVAPDFSEPAPADVSPSVATGPNLLDPNGTSPSTTDLPQGDEGHD